MPHRAIRFAAASAAAALLATTPLHAQDSYPARCGAGLPATSTAGYTPLPRGDVFCLLIADPKAPRSFVSMVREAGNAAQSAASTTLASVGIGDVFPLGRWNGSTPGDGIQLSLSAGVFAQFDLGTASYDLVNADYVIGLPLTIRRGRNSMRLRIYHQSSHLGDEYLLREPPTVQDRENLSFESLEAIVSRDYGPLRGYAGGEWLVNREPADLARTVAHAGLEFRPMTWIIPLRKLGGFRVVAATDVKASKEQDWKPGISVRAGVEYDRASGSEPPGRRWSLLLEHYEGPSPYGQFFRERVRYSGIGVHFNGF
jgi:Protein of unknown function (DUF1207)